MTISSNNVDVFAETIIDVNLIIAIAMNDLSAGQDMPIETGVSTVSNPSMLIAKGSDV